MPLEAATRKAEIGSLGSCLVEGDAEQRARERKIRRRALTLSIILQTIFLAVLLIAPLFAKTPPLAVQNFVPIPPYVHSSVPERSNVQQGIETRRPPACHFCAPSRIPPRVPVLGREDAEPTPPSFEGLNVGGGPAGQTPPGAIGIFDPRNQPQIPPPSRQHRIVRGGQVQAAMLVYRVEPKYPTLMQQIRRSGSVQLHAIISTDGTIESLQVISGDPGFYQSALDAVRQWRYKPTILNGQAVEVETVITVIYNIG